ncbi:epoxide hydrolase family protein [Frondihabitans cladoniiphilus]|uniref:Epoxide hydrolase n=1 Tax=Frondihabitans cladoniiphilus TaxID=715785 RepID=A0ABP8WCC1_9MICO
MNRVSRSAAPDRFEDEALVDLLRRLRSYRRVSLPSDRGWDLGTDGDYLAELVRYWADEYDWRTHEGRIRDLPWEIGGAAPHALRVVHQRATIGPGTSAPVLLLHGWPDSVLRFERLLPRLRDLDVVVPALPGFPFALPIAEGGLSAAAMADAVADMMLDLGHVRYVVSAGDVGCDVAEALAAKYPDNVVALHLADVSQYHFLTDLPDDLSAAEQRYVERGHRWQAAEGGYMHEQSTRPQTLAVGLNDSPSGLAAWLIEKLRAWTDSDGDIETVFSKDELLTWVMAYWTTGSIGTSFTPYAKKSDKRSRPTAPTVFTMFPKDLVNAPEEFARRLFATHTWLEFAKGGHFAAWEVPEDYETGIRLAVDLAAKVAPDAATDPAG